MVGTWIARRAESDSHPKRTTGEAGADGSASETARRTAVAIINHLVASNADTDSIATEVADIDAAANLHSDSGSNFDSDANANANPDTNAATNANANARA